jgi:hypothetical protein
MKKIRTNFKKISLEFQRAKSGFQGGTASEGSEDEEGFGIDLTKHRALLKDSRSSIQELKTQNKLLQEIVRNRSIGQDDSKFLTKADQIKYDDQALSSCLFSSPERNEIELAFNPKKDKDPLLGEIIAEFDKKRQIQMENMEKIEKNLENLKKNKNDHIERRPFKENDRHSENTNNFYAYQENKAKQKGKKEIEKPQVREKKVQKEISEIDDEIKSLVFKIKDAVHSKSRK